MIVECIRNDAWVDQSAMLSQIPDFECYVHVLSKLLAVSKIVVSRDDLLEGF